MFNQARLKLTIWYLLIIMSISVSFSFFIFQLLQNEIKRIALVQLERIEDRYDQQVIYGATTSPSRPIPLAFDQEIINDSRRRLLYVLLIVNGAILIISGGLGYLLAGETLKPIQDMVEDQNRFISDASHELRTPLTALKSTMEVSIRDKNLDLKEARTLIEESIHEVDKLHRLSDGLLQLARSKHTAKEPVLRKIRLDHVVHQAVRQITSLAAQKKIKIIVTVPRLTIIGQSEALIQVFVIALDNAIKYSSEHSTVEILGQKNTDTAMISVVDHGVGIARKDLPHIFDRFYRTDTARSKPDAGGYGLGLSIAQQIIASHQGSIQVQSQPAHGTTLSFIFPLHK